MEEFITLINSQTLNTDKLNYFDFNSIMHNSVIMVVGDDKNKKAGVVNTVLNSFPYLYYSNVSDNSDNTNVDVDKYIYEQQTTQKRGFLILDGCTTVFTNSLIDLIVNHRHHNCTVILMLDYSTVKNMKPIIKQTVDYVFTVDIDGLNFVCATHIAGPNLNSNIYKF